MKLTGHLTESIYRRYAIVSEADLSEGVAKLSALHQRENGAERVVVLMSERKGKARAKQERLEGEVAVNYDANLLKYGAGDRDRTGTGLSAHGILSPRRLPIPPLRRSAFIP
jgi:hypothetical protein